MPYAQTSAFLTMALGLEKELCTSTTTCSCAVASAWALWLLITSTTTVLITSQCIDLPLTLIKATKNTAMVYHISWISVRLTCQGPPSPLWIFLRHVLMLFGNHWNYFNCPVCVPAKGSPSYVKVNWTFQNDMKNCKANNVHIHTNENFLYVTVKKKF